MDPCRKHMKTLVSPLVSPLVNPGFHPGWFPPLVSPWFPAWLSAWFLAWPGFAPRFPWLLRLALVSDPGRFLQRSVAPRCPCFLSQTFFLYYCQ